MAAVNERLLRVKSFHVNIMDWKVMELIFLRKKESSLIFCVKFSEQDSSLLKIFVKIT